MPSVCTRSIPNLTSGYQSSGYLQRGGRPSAMDRILASRMGVAAIEALKEGQRNIMIGVVNDQMVNVPIARGCQKGQTYQ